jgi:hypothetical protein
MVSHNCAGRLEDHQKIHDNDLVKCLFCIYSTVNTDDPRLYGNHLNAHFKIRPYKCGYCEDRFFRFGDAKNHEDAKHEIIKDRYKCNKCHFKTYTRQSLVNHKRLTH